MCVCHLFSVEQKKETQGLRFFLSEDGGRYMASEKQVRSSFSSSVLNKQANKKRIYILLQKNTNKSCENPPKMYLIQKWCSETIQVVKRLLNLDLHHEVNQEFSVTCWCRGRSLEAESERSPPRPPRCTHSCRWTECPQLRPDEEREIWQKYSFPLLLALMYYSDHHHYNEPVQLL